MRKNDSRFVYLDVKGYFYLDMCFDDRKDQISRQIIDSLCVDIETMGGFTYFKKLANVNPF